MLGNLNIPRKFPERDGLGRGKAFPDLFGGQVGLEPVFGLGGRHSAEPKDTGIAQNPCPGDQNGSARFNSLFETAIGIKGVDRHPVEIDALVAATSGVDDRLSFVGALIHPEAAGASASRSGILTEKFSLEALRALLQGRGYWIVDGGGDDTENE